jgi:PhnB protein
MEFYRSIFGGELTVNTFKEFGASQDPSEDNKVMHSMLVAPDVTFMAADTPSGMDYTPGTDMSMSLSGDDEAKLRRYWQGLSQGAEVGQPLEQAPWGDTFGMLTDKFGVDWMVNITAPRG